MAVNDEVMVRSVFVLAHAGFNQRRILHSREPKAHIFPHRLEALGTGHTFACGRVKVRAATVIRDFEPASPIFRRKISRNAVHETVALVGPHRKLLLRKAVVSGRWPEEEHILFGRTNLVANGVREKFSHPRSACKDILVGDQPRTIRERDTITYSALKITR